MVGVKNSWVVGSRWAVGLGVALLPALIGMAPGAAPAQEASAPWPSEVQAVYKISLNAFEVGTFEFRSSVHDRTYSLSGHARISALLGLVSWQGTTQVSGSVATGRPAPAGFSFDYQGSRAGSVRMGFGQGAVQMLTVHPPEAPKAGAVPVQRAHLHGVIDPLSAVLALSRPRDANPCQQRVPIFDGKMRFDLALSFKRHEQVRDGTSGQPIVLSVCRVRVNPISGHAEDGEGDALRRNDGIEIAFRAVPEARIHVPHRISVPTLAGPASLTIDRIQIRTAGDGQIALVN